MHACVISGTYYVHLSYRSIHTYVNRQHKYQNKVTVFLRGQLSYTYVTREACYVYNRLVQSTHITCTNCNSSTCCFVFVVFCLMHYLIPLTERCVQGLHSRDHLFIEDVVMKHTTNNVFEEHSYILRLLFFVCCFLIYNNILQERCNPCVDLYLCHDVHGLLGRNP